jgi:hypothetical protein
MIFLKGTMNTPKRHHYVPEFLQRQFVNETGGLWTFDYRNREKGIWCGTGDNLLVEGHLYSYINSDGTKDVSLERWFSELEGISGPIVEKLIGSARKGVLPGLSRTERETWDFFLYQQWRRVPDLFASLLSPEQHQREIEELLDELHAAGRPVTNYERSELLAPTSLKRMRRNVRVATLKTGSGTVLSTLAARGIAVARISNPRKSFILGSRPVVKLTLPGVTELSDPRVELWLPISYDVMVGLGSIEHQEMLVPVNARQVRHQNEALAMQSSQIIGRSRELVQSLCRFVGSRVLFKPAGEWTGRNASGS